jgi:hypothetical protein
MACATVRGMPTSYKGCSNRELIMGPSETPGPLRPLQYNLELLANLIYLASRSESGQQQRYLNWASNVIEEMQHHPKLRE